MKRSIMDYFAVKPAKRKAPELPATDVDQPEQNSADVNDNDVSHSNPSTSAAAVPSSDIHSNKDDNDIGIINWKVLTDVEKLRVLTAPWCAPLGFQWPYSERKDGGKTRRKYLGPQHLTGQYSVFSYSVSKGGLFCRPCTFFAPDAIRGNLLNRLVKTPLQKFAHLTGKDGYLSTHLANKFHEDSVARAETFKTMMTGKAGDVAQQLNTAAAKQREKNRAALERIILAIEFLGRLGLPLRGHRDSGTLVLPSAGTSDIDYRQGNLRATLQLMSVCDDEVLREVLTTAGKNATYISPQSQNELISAIGTVVTKSIVEEVKEAKFFSLLADETTDVSRKEQLTVCLRYLRGGKICERFFCFAEAPDLTGAGLAKQLLTILKESGVDISNMVGQGYDGAAAMSGYKNGVQKHVRDECPSAMYTHCVSHSLNLCLMKAGEVPDIRKAVTLMHEIAVFFNDSNKRLLNLETAIQKECTESAHSRLKLHCTTRWVERQEAVRIFKELLPAIRASLNNISLWPSSDSAGKALLFSSALDDGGFLVALEVLLSVLEITKPLSVKLQAESQDIHHAVDSVQDCVKVLHQMRSDEQVFHATFARAEKEYGDEIRMPRTTGRQTHRANHPADTPEEYYRRAVFLPYIDVCLSQLHERFQTHSAKAYLLSLLLPAYCNDSGDTAALKEAAELFSIFLPGGVDCLNAELMRWKAYWARQASPNNPVPKRVVDAVSVAETLGTYPVIETLLRIFATLPVTTATGERSFSALKLIKTYLRSTIKEERLNGLALLYINKDLVLVHDDVINEFGRYNRRLVFI